MEKQLKVTYVKSVIGYNKNQAKIENWVLTKIKKKKQ